MSRYVTVSREDEICECFLDLLLIMALICDFNNKWIGGLRENSRVYIWWSLRKEEG